MHLTVEKLRGMSDEELIERHNELSRTTAQGGNVFLNELARRDHVRQGARMEDLTKSINILTVVIMVATIVGVAVSVYSTLS